MVSCKRCGRQGWRYQMEASEGSWYCESCFSIVEKGEIPASAESEQAICDFIESRHAYLEFARYLASTGAINEYPAENGTDDLLAVAGAGVAEGAR